MEKRSLLEMIMSLRYQIPSPIIDSLEDINFMIDIPMPIFTHEIKNLKLIYSILPASQN